MSRAGAIRKIKAAKSYTYAELARVTGKSEATVRIWGKDGMRVMVEGRPHLILGSDARAYLEARFLKSRTKLKIGEARCFHCSCRRMLEPEVAEIVPKRPTGWCLRGLCSHCGGLCSRWIAERDIPLHAKKLSIDLYSGIQA